MIHINKSNGKHELLTSEQVKEKYPQLHEAINLPAPFKEYADKLKEIRKAKNITLREMAMHIGISAVKLSEVEQGYVPATQRIVESYHTITPIKEACK